MRNATWRAIWQKTPDSKATYGIVAAATLPFERPSVLSASATPFLGEYTAYTTHAAIVAIC